VTAARLPTFPPWALTSRDHVLSGGLEQDLLAALDLMHGRGP
jgi:hypothetical protein